MTQLLDAAATRLCLPAADARIAITKLITFSPANARGPLRRGPVLFKSCGWAGWDLAAARCALEALSTILDEQLRP